MTYPPHPLLRVTAYPDGADIIPIHGETAGWTAAHPWRDDPRVRCPAADRQRDAVVDAGPRAGVAGRVVPDGAPMKLHHPLEPIGTRWLTACGALVSDDRISAAAPPPHLACALCLRWLRVWRATGAP